MVAAVELAVVVVEVVLRFHHLAFVVVVVAAGLFVAVVVTAIAVLPQSHQMALVGAAAIALVVAGSAEPGVEADPTLLAAAMVSQSPLRSQHFRQKIFVEAVVTAMAELQHSHQMVLEMAACAESAAVAEPALLAVVTVNPFPPDLQCFHQRIPV